MADQDRERETIRSRSNNSTQILRSLVVAVILFEILLVAIFLIDVLFGEPSQTIQKLFDLDGEKNIPALFSSAQLFLVGVVFLSLAYQPNKLHYTSPVFLVAIGMAFFFLSIDEAISIHEELTSRLRHIEWLPRFKGNHGLWIVPYLSIGLLILLVTYKDLLRVWRNSRQEMSMMALGFAIFLVGAVGMEIISFQFLREEHIPQYVYQLEVAIEEFLEMVGITIVLYGAAQLSLANLKRHIPNQTAQSTQ